MAKASEERVVVYGAGAIGGAVGLALHLAGVPVTFLVRDVARYRKLAEAGLELTAMDPRLQRRCGRLAGKEAVALFTEDPACLAAATVVFVGVKRGANPDPAPVLRARCRGVPVFLLQNGLGAAADFGADELPCELVETVVKWNTVGDALSGRIGFTTEDAELWLPDTPSAQRIVPLFSGGPILCQVCTDFLAVQYGKLTMNLMNAVNALAGVSVGEMTLDPDFRAVGAAALTEGKAVLTAGHGPAPRMPGKDGFLLKAVPFLFGRLPQWLFVLLLGRKMRAMGAAYSSTLVDLRECRKTEIAFLNGAVVAMAAAKGVAAPINAELVRLVEKADKARAGSPKMSGAQLRAAVLGRQRASLCPLL